MNPCECPMCQTKIDTHPIQIWLMTKPGQDTHPKFLMRDVTDDRLYLINRETLIDMLTKGQVCVMTLNG